MTLLVILGAAVVLVAALLADGLLSRRSEIAVRLQEVEDDARDVAPELFV